MPETWEVGRKGMSMCIARHGHPGKGTSSERERGHLGGIFLKSVIILCGQRIMHVRQRNLS